MKKQPRVLVVGAGATGCNVAHFLHLGGNYEVEVWEQSAELGSGGSLRSVQTARGITAELGAQVLSFEMQNKIVEQRCAELQPWMSRLRDPGVWPDPIEGSKLSHTEERPSPWWEHYNVIGGTASFLDQMLSTSGAKVHLERSVRVLSVEQEKPLQVVHDGGVEEFDVVVIACKCDAGGLQVTAPGQVRHASLIQLDSLAAEALRKLWIQECREMGFDDNRGLITVWTWEEPVIATVHHVDAKSAISTWLGVDEGIEVLETHNFFQHSFAKPKGCIVANEDPLIVYCGDWCGGTGTFSSCVVSAKAAADMVKAKRGYPNV